jgi:hypothetical protein
MGTPSFEQSPESVQMTEQMPHLHNWHCPSADATVKTRPSSERKREFKFLAKDN